MIANKTQFFGGLGLMIGFVIVLIIFFSPVFGGKNGLDYLDNLYNSISKGSAYYIPKVKKECEAFKGNSVNVTLAMADKTHAQQTAKLFKASDAEVVVAGTDLKVTGDLGMILENCLADADMFNWWKAFEEMEKDLKRQKKFKEAKIVALVVKKAVESSYNYYKIEPQKIGDRWGIVIVSLLFYVIYTLWYGFAIMFMFEGWGMKLEH
jgi:hypothetical protein